MFNVLEYNPYKIRAIKKSKTLQDRIKKIYTVYNPVTDKKRAQARGFWIENNKLYKDHIKFISFDKWSIAYKKAINICNNKNQRCVFIKTYRGAYIIDKFGKIISYYKIRKIIYINNKSKLKAIIRKYKDGLTIYKTLKGFYAEVYL